MRALAALLLLASAGAHAQSTGLTPGQSASFTLPANAYTTGLHFDVPAGVTSFKVELESDTPNVDLDLFLRYGNAFSSQSAYGRPMSFEALQAQAQYYAVSGGDEEAIAIGRSNYRPVRAGRWHLAALNFASVAAVSRIKVEYGSGEPTPLQFDVHFDQASAECDVAPWNDSTPATPVGGNPGTTLGQQRRNAMLEALRQLATGLDSQVPITVRACWDALEAQANSATLAGAAPDDFVIDDRSLVFTGGATLPQAAYLPDKYAFYSAAPAARLGGTRACSLRGGSCEGVTDMTITYNRRIGEPGVLGGQRFYLGYDTAPAGTIDFVGVSVHELGHGLGFLSLVRTTGTVGAKPVGRDDIYGRQVVDNRQSPYRPFMRLTDAERADAMVSATGLSWMDARAVNSPQNTPSGFPGVLLFAPNPIEPGSTLSHLSSFYNGQLMTPSINSSRGVRQLGLAVPMLYAMGWDPDASTFPTAPAPFAGLWFDRTHDGHGVDFQRVYTDAAGFDIYSLFFYTYDANGRPEWYIAIGPMVDGVFVAQADAFGNSLVRYRYAGGPTPQQAVPTESGQAVFDFNQPSHSPACNDGTTRAGVGTLGVFRYTLGGVTGAWCMEELIPAAGRPDNDLTGTWYGGSSDSGWGSSVGTAAISASQTLLFSTLYYPDSTGAGRWAFISAPNYQPGQAVPVFERRGYCRSCPPSLVDTQIGTLTPSLTQPVQSQAGNNRISFDIRYGGPEGGRFTRNNVPYELLSVPQ
ncbi:MAG: hypothetical protein IT479_14840 [Xanthomonadales bacterium]|nr:hypothetical protein [Xanthomonadales bacterium]MCC6594535.1 hypothetical protein [Xanthomonadales bacterium]MCE7931813.1 hypothetical protein [Xanthomonadales bacterium PRO6]